MKQKLVFLGGIMLFMAFKSMSQFSKDVEQSYLLYNKARILEASGHIDSAAIHIKKSIHLNPNNGQVRYYAWEFFLRSGRYRDAIDDIKDYYVKNTLPEKPDDIFFVYGPEVTAKAKESNEIKEFVASYEGLKKTNSQTVRSGNELKKIVDNCMAVDQFARTDFWWNRTQNDTYYTAKLINYADSINMEAIALYVRKKGFPSSVAYNGETMSFNFVNLITHFLQEPENYAELSVWKYLDSTIQQAVYNGIFPARLYLHFLDNRHLSYCYINHIKPKQLYGTYSSPSFDIDTKKYIRVYDEIDDIAHVDERRLKWLQPTLYEESLIDTTIRLPENYRRK